MHMLRIWRQQFRPKRMDTYIPNCTRSHHRRRQFLRCVKYSSVVNQLEHIILRLRVSKDGHCYTGAAIVIATAV